MKYIVLGAPFYSISLECFICCCLAFEFKDIIEMNRKGSSI